MYINTATYKRTSSMVTSRQSSCQDDPRVETMATRYCIVLLCLLSAIMYCSGRFTLVYSTQCTVIRATDQLGDRQSTGRYNFGYLGDIVRCVY